MDVRPQKRKNTMCTRAAAVEENRIEGLEWARRGVASAARARFVLNLHRHRRCEKRPFDLEMLQALPRSSDVPIIAKRGRGPPRAFAELFSTADLARGLPPPSPLRGEVDHPRSKRTCARSACRCGLEEDPKDLKFDVSGLVPAEVAGRRPQGGLLTLGLNERGVRSRISIAEGFTSFYSLFARRALAQGQNEPG
jgi:hypothetical protein